MQFSDTANKQGLIEDITFITKANTTNYPLADRTRNINSWYSKVVGWIINATNRWQWDDSNQTDAPSATTSLVNGQQDYEVIDATPNASQDWLQLERVEILDSSGNALLLTPIDKADIGIALDEFKKTDGTPQYYDFVGTSVYLYPAPNYDIAKGLTIYFNRAPLVFTASDTTKKAGFASIYHKVLSLGASFDWALTNNKQLASTLRQEIIVYKEDIQKHYSKRGKYEVPMLKRLKKSYK